MSERNYWTRLRRSQISRRTMLTASARAGVGAAGLALVGCGDDDDDDAAVAQTEQPAEQQTEQAEQAQAQQQAEAQAEQAVEQEEEPEQAEEQAAPVSEFDSEATVRIAINRGSAGLDPLRAGSHTNYFPRNIFYDPGMANDPNGADLISNLVNTFETPDEVTYVLNITPGILWHDGTTYTAHDTQFTYQRAGGIAEYHDGGETSDHPAGWATSRATFGPPGAWPVGGDEVIDDLTMRINLAKPSASLPGSVFSRAIHHQSKAYIEEVGDEEADRTVMGTGPWRHVSNTADTEFIAERNEDYFRSRPGETPRQLSWEHSQGPYLPYSKALEGLVRPEQLSAVAGVEAGEIDIAQQLAPDLVRPFLDRDGFLVKWSSAGAGTAHEIMPNTHLADWAGAPNPFLDIRVRQAANHAINRTAYIDNLLSGQETPYLGQFPGVFGWEGVEERLAPVFMGYDPERAKQLMAEAGYPDGFDTTFHIVTDFVPAIPTLALVVQQDLADIGIRTTIKEYPSSEYFVEIRKFDQAGLWWFFTNTIPEPETVLGSTVAQGFYNVTPLPETRILELYELQEVTVDPVERNMILADLYVEAYTQAQFIYLHNSLEGALMRDWVDWDIGDTQGWTQTFAYSARILKT